MSMIRILLAALVLAGLAGAGIAIAQDVAEDRERSRFVRFVERQISTPNRQIRLGEIEGALSSDVRISEITIADREGVWLVIENARLVWSRLALLRGRLSIDTLEADAIRILRNPLPAEEDVDVLEEADEEFRLPELPVSVVIDRLAVPRVEIAEGVIGPAAALGVEGSVRLADGELDTDIAIERLDRPGTLSLEASFDDETRQLAIDFILEEPENGVLANALDIEGRPPVTFEINGDGPLSDFEAVIRLDVAGETLLSGTSRITGENGGLRFLADIDGDLSPIVPDLYAPLVEGGSEVTLNLLRQADGSFVIEEGELASGVARLAFSGALAPDGVPTRLTVDGRLAREDGEPVALPGGGGDSTVRSATIDADLAEDGTFAASIALEDLDSPLLVAPSFEIEARGTAQNLSDPGARSVTFIASGRAEGLTSSAPALADALGATPSFTVEGAWASGQPLRLDRAEVSTAGLDAAFAGTVADGLSGTYRLRADDLGAFRALVGRPLGGAVAIEAEGTVGFDGLFELAVDGTARNLEVGIPAVDRLLAGETTLSGGVARGEEEIAFQEFRIASPEFSVTADGVVSPTRADLTAEASLSDLSLLAPEAEGPLSARLSVTGNPQRPDVVAEVTSPGLVLRGQPLDDLAAGFDGTLELDSEIPFDLDGRLAVTGEFAGEPLNLEATLVTGEAGRTLRDLSVRVADATASGTLAFLAETGLLEGDLSISIPELSRVAPLALVEASGSVSADVSLSAENGTQSARVDAEARQVEAAGISLGFADIDLAVDDAFGVPAIEGTAEVRALEVAGLDIRSARLAATRTGYATRLALSADLGQATLEVEGSLARIEDGFRAAIEELVLSRDGFAARLLAPTSATVTDGQVAIEETRLSIGDGTVTIGGTLGETVDLEAALEDIPLAIANLVVPDLAAAGSVSGTVDLSGTAAEPVVSAALEAEGVTAAPLAERGIAPVDVSARGSYADGTATIERLAVSVGDGTLRAFGTVGETLDLEVSVEDLPLALANAVVPELALSGTVSASADLSGSLADPEANFQATVANASAAPLRQAGVDPVSATVAGRYDDGRVTLTTAEAQIAGGTVTATGTIGERLDVSARIEGLPLGIVNAIRPGLDVSGTLSGTVTATGPLARPRVAFDVSAPTVSAAPLREAELPPASASARGVYDRGTVALEEATVRVGGGSIVAEGAVGRTLDLDVDLSDLPLSIANAFRPDLGLSGNLSGTARATGSLTNPSATFDVRATSVSAAPLREAGVGEVAVTARGRYANGAVELASLDVSGAGLSAQASGRIPLSGPGLDVSATATAPLSLAKPFLAERGATIAGNARVDLTARGSLADPVLSGDVSASGIELRDPQTGLLLTGGSLDARLEGDRVVIDSLSASLGEGTVSVSGSIGITPPFPADLEVTARGAQYTDGRLFSVTFDADLSVTGPLAGSPLVAGDVRVDRAEIIVPSRLSGPATLIDVTHVNTPPDVLETLRRARLGPFAEREPEGAEPEGVRLDVTVSAPRRIFIRGRGIDAELGGEVRLTGPVSDIEPVGAFNLIRGRINILGQRIVFTEGAVTLLGDLDPEIRLIAETQANEVTVRVIVTGSARNPQILFESEPELPQDEVLAQLLFGRSLDELSPFQLARLAAAVAELAGAGGGPGILEQVRIFSGLDNLEVVTTADGDTAAQAGRYISDNIYLGVRAGPRSSGVTVNLDITRGLTVRGEALTDESSIGLYYEREY